MAVAVGACASTQAFPLLGSHRSGLHGRDNRGMLVLPVQPVLGQRDQVVLDSSIGMDGILPSVLPPVSWARQPGRGMRPAGWNSLSPKKLSVVSAGKTSEVGQIVFRMD